MLAWAIGLFALALVAGYFGFFTMATGAAWVGQIVLISALAVVVFNLIARLFERRRV